MLVRRLEEAGRLGDAWPVNVSVTMVVTNYDPMSHVPCLTRSRALTKIGLERFDRLPERHVPAKRIIMGKAIRVSGMILIAIGWNAEQALLRVNPLLCSAR